MTNNLYQDHLNLWKIGWMKMDVMRYLINVWYWRARLSLNSFVVENENIAIDVDNLGRASTSNATVRYVDGGGPMDV